jgi:hypothetical protein
MLSFTRVTYNIMCLTTFNLHKTVNSNFVFGRVPLGKLIAKITCKSSI